ncbi:S1/P1 nuclease (plasmid) [Rhizobium leguminosarum]
MPAETSGTTTIILMGTGILKTSVSRPTGEDADPVNLLTQIQTLTAGLPSSSGLPDNVRSYDLVWLLHLVGDAHQPLHATARFSQAHKHGDQGGNLDDVINSKGASNPTCTPIGTACLAAIPRPMARLQLCLNTLDFKMSVDPAQPGHDHQGPSENMEGGR